MADSVKHQITYLLTTPDAHNAYMHITHLKIHAIAPTPTAKPKAHTVISYKLLPPIMERKQKQSILTFKNSAKGDKSIKAENAPLAYALGKLR